METLPVTFEQAEQIILLLQQSNQYDTTMIAFVVIALVPFLISAVNKLFHL